jgi:hypothetical protein
MLDDVRNGQYRLIGSALCGRGRRVRRFGEELLSEKLFPSHRSSEVALRKHRVSISRKGCAMTRSRSRHRAQEDRAARPPPDCWLLHRRSPRLGRLTSSNHRQGWVVFRQGVEPLSRNLVLWGERYRCLAMAFFIIFSSVPLVRQLQRTALSLGFRRGVATRERRVP